MQKVFSDLEGLRIAVEMERRGEDFYRRAAKVGRSEEMISLLTSLANDEIRHGHEFRRLADRAMAGDADEGVYDEETSAILTAIAADIAFPGGLMALRRSGFDDPVAVLAGAIQSEKDSILFYTELANCTKSAEHRAVFLEIARQERGHLALLLNKLNALSADEQKG